MESLGLGGDVQTGKKGNSLGELGELPWLSYTNLIEHAIATIEQSN